MIARANLIGVTGRLETCKQLLTVEVGRGTWVWRRKTRERMGVIYKRTCDCIATFTKFGGKKEELLAAGK